MTVPSLKLSNGHQMPLVGLGTWMSKDPVELEAALEAALEMGYRHIDTACVYENEAIIGKVLNKWLSQGTINREDLFITTKLAPSSLCPDQVEGAIKTSLKNLGLDYVDLYLIHFPIYWKIIDGKIAGGNDTDHLGLWKAMEKQVDQGRTKAIGISNFNIEQIQRILGSSPKINPAVNQIENHVYLQQRDLVKFCQDNGIVVTAYSPLGSPGYNKFLETRGLQPKNLPDMLNDATIKAIATTHKKTNAQILLRYQIQRNIVVIPKSVTVSRLRENFDIFNFLLSSEEIKALDALDVGEEARVCDFKGNGLETHKEWPFGH